MAEKTQDFWAIFAEQIDRAAKTAEFRLNLLKSRGDRMLHRTQSQMHLLNIAADRGRCGFELGLRRHPLLDPI